MTIEERSGGFCGELFWEEELGKEAVHRFKNLREEQVTAGNNAATKIFEGRHGCHDRRVNLPTSPGFALPTKS